MKFSTVQWISWIAATVVAALTMSAYAFKNFETVDHAKEVKADITQRLIEIRDDVKEIRRNTSH